MALILILSILAAAALAAPPGHVTILDDTVYTDKHMCYTADHDIVAIHISPYYNDDTIRVFFVLFDSVNNIYKGLYELHLNVANGRYNSTARKLLDDGTCITSDKDNIYFGSTSGIYTYTDDTVERLGSVAPNVKHIQKATDADLIYIVSADGELLLVTERGDRMLEHGAVKRADQISLDVENNLYFIEKRGEPEVYEYLQYFERYLKPKVVVGDSVRDIAGLPEQYTRLRLGRAMATSVVMVNNYLYKLFPNGTSVNEQVGFLNIPTAYSLDTGVFQVYSLQNKLYCYNVLEGIGEALGKAVDAAVKTVVASIATVLTHDSNVGIDILHLNGTRV